MKPMVKQNNKGRTLARDDIHHATCDGGEGNRKAKAKSQRKAARQSTKTQIAAALIVNGCDAA